jgi:NTP pyrophosphatase (non-canonical NTP hydrolase)
MELTALSQRANDIRRQYSQLEQKRYGRSWTREEVVMGFVGDTGDLVKLVMAKKGIRHIPGVQEKLEHELADCLWSILVLADLYSVDLESVFLRTMDELEQHIASQP